MGAKQKEQPGKDTTSSEGPTVDSWSAKDQRIVVSQPAAGFLYDLVLRAKIDADPTDVYDVLIDPNSHEIFRGIKATLTRTTLEDDGKGRRKLLVGHRALTRFMFISVTFDTELYVWEDDVSRTIRFTNARSDGFMSKFDGTWHVQPFTQQTLDSIYKGAAGAGQQPRREGGHNWLGSILHHGSSSSSAQEAPSALVTLNQALSPRVKPPGPVAHLVRGLCGRVLHNMMEDLRAEVARRKQLEEVAQGASSSSRSSGVQSLMGPISSSSSSRQAATSPSLPVASLTLSSSRSSSSDRSSSSGRSRWWDSPGGRCAAPADEDGAGADGSPSDSHPGFLSAQGLGTLFAAAVPQAITIKL